MAYQIKISLDDAQPAVWRRVLIAPETSFATFHMIVQAAMGWEVAHMFAFFHPENHRDQIGIPYDDGWGGLKTRDAAQIHVNQELTMHKRMMKYEYDFGDSWLHTILLEEVNDIKVLHPLCTEGNGACPPEDCGGLWGYYDLVERVNHPKSEEDEELVDWLGLEEGETWDVHAFDLEEAGERLRLYLRSR